MKYYISLYELYPIYEPAEGGYYYEGATHLGSQKCSSLRKARSIMKHVVESGDYGEMTIATPWRATSDSKYIGEGYELRIETRPGCHERGYHPYC